MDTDTSRKIIADLAFESWRFCNEFEHALPYIIPDKQQRPSGRCRWFRKKLYELLGDAGMKILVWPSGTEYNIGMAVTPINLEEFEPNEQLEIEQVLEPIIMSGSSVIRTGRVTLRRKAGVTEE